MNLIEISHPAGALGEEDRALLAGEIIAGLVGDGATAGADAPEATLRRARTMTHVGFRELAAWHTGDGPWDPAAAPPLWITMSVPEAWREETSRAFIGRIRRAVRRLDAVRGRARTGGDLWINIVGIADGSIGLNGTSMTADDVVGYMTEEFRTSYTAGDPDVPEGVVVDPMCGMRVTLGKRAVTLEQGGDTLGFCAEACRAAYARREGLPVPS
ncbi:hypothetical protein RM572_01450 [Streptomyces sp. DSM 42041]|uniref:YHS domain-containing protein n=1 Tax=Streptomyces hazeniae TaxID=3075538 RepID=A0ABU2NL05_9ACTN|nr:hypothetical protein [Streptomyces sp. DSM 42041]MDT0377440.1 hypothetical protein [Streptomyces sp. DSM 42041]